MINKIIKFPVIIAACFLSNSSCLAQPRSVHEQHQVTSDIIVIAKAISHKNDVGALGLPITFWRFQTMAVYKGVIDDKFEALIRSESPEWTANCCDSGRVYLMYLVKTDRGMELIRGIDGIFVVENNK